MLPNFDPALDLGASALPSASTPVALRRSFQFKAVLRLRVRQQAERHLAMCAELYNAALEERRTAWQRQRVSVSAAQQSAQLPDLKRLRPEFADLDAQVLQGVVQRLDRAFQAFFRRVKAGQAPGYPRFRSARRYDSITYKQTGWKLEGRWLTLRGVGRMKLFLSREIQGRIKTVTLKRDACGDWWVTFSCDDVPASPLPATGAVVGLDVGLEAFLTTSDAERMANPRPLVAATAGLRKAQRVVSKRRKGGHRRRKAVRWLAVRHRRVERVRLDFHHKVAGALVARHDLIAVEALQLKGLARGMLARSVHDVAWGQFLAILSDKAAGAGRTVIAVDARGTSQQCSACGTMPERPKPLAERWHGCPCGYAAHRDENAARNILQRALDDLDPVGRTGRAGPSASRPASRAAA